MALKARDYWTLSAIGGQICGHETATEAAHGLQYKFRNKLKYPLCTILCSLKVKEGESKHRSILTFPTINHVVWRFSTRQYCSSYDQALNTADTHSSNICFIGIYICHTLATLYLVLILGRFTGSSDISGGLFTPDGWLSQMNLICILPLGRKVLISSLFSSALDGGRANFCPPVSCFSIRWSCLPCNRASRHPSRDGSWEFYGILFFITFWWCLRHW